MSYDCKSAARSLTSTMSTTEEWAACEKRILTALYVAQAEAWSDAIRLLDDSGHGLAAALLASKAEAMWTRREP